MEYFCYIVYSNIYDDLITTIKTYKNVKKANIQPYILFYIYAQ